MSTDRQINFRRVLRALRERQELEQLLEAQPGESLVDAAKRLQSRALTRERMAELLDIDALVDKCEFDRVLYAEDQQAVENATRDLISTIIDEFASVGEDNDPERAKHEAKEMVAVIQVVGDDPDHVAGVLECMAARIRRVGAFIHQAGQTFAHVKYSAGIGEGECPIDAGTFWGVGFAENFPGEEIAFFANKNIAERFAQGKPIFDDEGLQPPAQGDLCVVRSILVGSIWNSTEPEPGGAKQ
jgi:hypothetical protein